MSIIIACSTIPLLRADVLTYKNGDRVSGTFVSKESDVIVFKSPRFGELRVSIDEAVVEISTPTTSLADATPPPTPAAAIDTNLSPAPAPTAPALATAQPQTHETTRKPKKKHWWNDWHGKLATSAGIDSDTSDHTIIGLDGRITRKWTRDDFLASINYNYISDLNVVTMDMIKGEVRWRHTFGEKWFGEYRSKFERDRITSKALQLQQQLGAGRILYDTKRIRLLLGLAENLFSTRPLNEGDNSRVSDESIFCEATLTLPWRITITERGVYYFSIGSSSRTGWENKIEFSKKLTEAFSVGFSYDVRFRNPDPRMPDYARTRFLLGLEF